MKNFVQEHDIIEVTAPYNVTSGDGVLVGGLFGIAACTALSGERVNMKTTGVFDVKKVSAQAWASVGAAVYWDDAAKNLTTTSSSNTLVAKNVETAANPSGTGRVRLNG